MLPNFAHSLFQRFEAEGIPLLLAGGWAVCHHGYSRLTLDIDWVCPRSMETAATDLMTKLGFAKRTSGMASRFSKPADPSFPFIDLIWVDDASMQKMAGNGKGAGLRGEIPVISFRALLAMKLHALKDGEERDFKDLMDLRLLLRYNPGVIPEDELRVLCLRYAGPTAYPKIRSADD